MKVTQALVAVGHAVATGTGVNVAQATVAVGRTVLTGRGVAVGATHVGTADVTVGVDHHEVGVGVFTEDCPGVPVGASGGSVGRPRVGRAVGAVRVAGPTCVATGGITGKVGRKCGVTGGITGSVGRGRTIPGVGV